jgi:hypothetical protein
MNPELLWFGLVWAALLLWVLVGWRPHGPDESDAPGSSGRGRARPGAAGRPGDALGGTVATANQHRTAGG